MRIQNQWELTELARKIYNAYTTTTLAGKQISYMWIPSHCNLEGNELTDKLVHLVNNSFTSLNFTYQDVKRIISIDTHDQWENKWAIQIIKLHEIKRTTYSWSFPENISRKQETAFTRLR